MFIRHGQYFNLNAPLSAEVIAWAGGAHALKFRDALGREISTASGAQGIDLEKLTAPLLPAGPASTVICISPTGAVTAAVVVGYRVCRTGLEPLYLVEPPEDSVRFLTVGAHGLVRLDDGMLFPNIEAAKASLGAQPVPEPEPEHVEPALPKLVTARRRG